jgi:hypothetical protein
MCLLNNKPSPNWTPTRRLIWNLRCEIFISGEEVSTLKKERSLFDKGTLVQVVPYEYPYSSARFVRHCSV